MFPAAYSKLLLLRLEAYDLAPSKLERNSARDREDVKYLARAAPLDLAILRSGFFRNFDHISQMRRGTI